MKKAVCLLLTLLILLSVGCTKQKEPVPVVPAETKPAQPTAAPETEPVPTVPPTKPETEPVDIAATATPTVPEGMCKVCGLDRGDYDGYCYYCHPDFLFTCLSCGYEQPYHRPANGLCYECDAAQGSVDAASGATG